MCCVSFVDVSLYDPDCEFSDPFVAFNGRQRFKENLENLAGGFIIDSFTRTLETSVFEGNATLPPTYRTKLMVKLQLGLPWCPVLAWPWGVEHVFDLAGWANRRPHRRRADASVLWR